MREQLRYTGDREKWNEALRVMLQKEGTILVQSPRRDHRVISFVVAELREKITYCESEAEILGLLKVYSGDYSTNLHVMAILNAAASVFK